MKEGAGFILFSYDLLQVLLVQGPSLKWSFPKGHREVYDDASDLKTAMREMFEETGLHPTSYNVRTDGFKLPGKNHPYTFFYAQMNSPTASLRSGSAHEILSLGWFSIHTIETLNTNAYVSTWCREMKNPISFLSILYEELRPTFEDVRRTLLEIDYLLSNMLLRLDLKKSYK
jgi:8-oxo-dGTP pyrophosphatase MutT (NUDIX family)